MQLRHSVAVGALLVILLALTTIAVGGHQQATMNVTVVDSTCIDGNLSEITMRVQVNESRTVTPHVWSSKSHVQMSWKPRNVSLHAGTQFVQLTRPEDRVAVRGDRAQLALNDGQKRLITNWEVDECQ